MVRIIKRRLTALRESGEFTPTISDWNADDLVTYSNSYIYNQAQPAKALYILNKCVGNCRMLHVEDPSQGLEISHEIIRQAFLSLKIDIDEQKGNVKLVIPPVLRKKYNYSLNQMPMGNNTYVGNEDQLEMLDANMLNVETPSALLLGEAGIGKTALIEQWIYNRNQTPRKVAVVSLAIEKLGELDENVVIARMRDLLNDLRQIRQTTLEANPHLKFDMALFIDEIHKLNNYGPTSGTEGSSAAMNALKEGLARGAFPIIGATTDYEYRANIVGDLAFDRRFGKIAMQQPTLDQVVDIMKRRLEADNEIIKFQIHCSDKMFHEIASYADSFIETRLTQLSHWLFWINVLVTVGRSSCVPRVKRQLQLLTKLSVKYSLPKGTLSTQWLLQNTLRKLSTHTLLVSLWLCMNWLRLFDLHCTPNVTLTVH